MSGREQATESETQAELDARRAKYSPELKQLIREKYPFCVTLEDKQELAREAGIDHIHKLYNLASRLGVTRTNNDAFEGAYSRPLGAPGSRRTRFADVSFSAADDRYLRRQFGRKQIADIAFFRNLPESALLYRARQLGLRRAARYWGEARVLDWLGIERGAWQAARQEGVDVFPLRNRQGKVATRLVSTTSLARWLIDDKRFVALVQAGADEFFVREVIESAVNVARGEQGWERCTFLGSDHLCQNPFAGVSFGLFCTKNERHEAGEDPKCSVRLLRIDDLRSQGGPEPAR